MGTNYSAAPKCNSGLAASLEPHRNTVGARAYARLCQGIGVGFEREVGRDQIGDQQALAFEVELFAQKVIPHFRK